MESSRLFYGDNSIVPPCILERESFDDTSSEFKFRLFLFLLIYFFLLLLEYKNNRKVDVQKLKGKKIQRKTI